MELHSAKGLMLLLILTKIVLYVALHAYELNTVRLMTTLDTSKFPAFYPEDWPEFRIRMMKHLALTGFTACLFDVFVLIAIAKNWLYFVWNTFQLKMFPEKISKVACYLKSVTFFNGVFMFYILMRYFQAAVLHVIGLLFDHKCSQWPHNVVKHWSLWTVGVDIFGCALMASWEWLGDYLYFSPLGALSIFTVHFLILFLEPTSIALKLKYGRSIYGLKSDSPLHDLLSSVSSTCGKYSMKNFKLLKREFGRIVRTCGYRSFSTVIIDDGLIEQMYEMEPLVQELFPETAGPDDADQMFMGAVAHDIGHAMTGQVLWYHALGFGTIYALLTWLLLGFLMQKPILFRSFGYRQRPAPAVCLLIFYAIGLLYSWYIVGAPLLNLVSWLMEYEADEYATSVGLGIGLQKYLYGVQAAGMHTRRCFSLPMSMYHDDHPPFAMRNKWLS